MRALTFLLRPSLCRGLVLLLALPACTDPYLPDIIKTPPSYLVVDGFINSQGPTTFKLTRTYAVGASTAAPVETRATVYVEDNAGTRYLLTESSLKGFYTAAALPISPARKYRLHFNTLTGKEYASDFVAVKPTPAVDAVNWQAESTGLNIAVNTHDATGTTQYYRWETDETWEITPIYNPTVEYVNNAMRTIVVPFPSLCWGNAHSTAIQVYKTTALTQDVVVNFRLRQLPVNSERLNTQYSLLVQQHALTKEEYEYWELLRKNTESIGSLFDPQPAQLTGNVHCLSNSVDLALGFVGTHSVTEKRIFIRRQELPQNWRLLSGYESCQPVDTISLYPPAPAATPAQILASTFSAATGYLPINSVYANGGVAAYTGKSRDCVDCRTRGTSIKPSYWP